MTAAIEAAGIKKPLTLRTFFSNVEAHPVVLDFVLLKFFNLDWLPWLPDTLFHEIEKTFKSSIAEVNRQKILATQTLHVTDACWEHWEVFEKVVVVLNGIPPQLDVVQAPDVSQLMRAVDMIGQVRSEEYSEQVSRYVAACFLHDHVHYAPPPCDFAQVFISDRKYVCHDCGKVGDVSSSWSGLCESCTGTYHTDKPFTFEPDPDKVRKGLGQSVTVSATYDPDPIKERYLELAALPLEAVSIKESDTDIQAAKLVAAVDYMNSGRKTMVDQLSDLKVQIGGAGGFHNL